MNTQKIINELVDLDMDYNSDEWLWNTKLSELQNSIGVECGSYASMYFDGKDNEWNEDMTQDERKSFIEEYVSIELSFQEVE